MSKVFTSLGDELVNKNGETLKVKDIRGEGKVLAVYFSAHWCPPCRGFTPKLAKFYEKTKDGPNGDKFELVFVSSDKDDASFKEYLSEMPWWALPFERRTEKGQLSKFFNVAGIPTLIFLDAQTGEVINKNGRGVVDSDPEAKNFPWKAKTLYEILKGGEYINNNNEQKSFEQDIKGKVFGIYFSAHWCPPCKGFTPVLSEVYKLINSDTKKFEVIFVSSDQNENAFKEYFNEMPFLALPFDSDAKDELSEYFDVEGIPTLIIIDEDMKVITRNGRSVVSGDKEGKKFPWSPEPVEELNEVSAPKLNEEPCLIYFPGDDEEKSEKMKAILKPLGQASLALAKKEGGDPDLYFLVAYPTTNEIVTSLSGFIDVNPKEETLVILDIPSTKKYIAEKQEYTKEVVEQFVKDYKEEKLPGKNLRD